MKLTNQDVNSIARGRAQAEIRNKKPSRLKHICLIAGICLAAILAFFVSFLGGAVLLGLVLGLPLFLYDRKFRKVEASIRSELQNEWKEYIE